MLCLPSRIALALAGLPIAFSVQRAFVAGLVPLDRFLHRDVAIKVLHAWNQQRQVSQLFS